MTTQELLALWVEADQSPVGLGIICDNRRVLQQRLYHVRGQLQNEAFNHISILIPDIENHLWLVKQDALS